MMGMGMGFGIFGLLFMVLLWAGVIILAIWLVRVLFPLASPPPAGPDWNARQILDNRFARGEITHEQYELMKETISKEMD